ncbi:hypothetical protein MMC30_004272 [Trapelia coarctata]|nr:hypothetical protein [Trapelia coarctata]
MTAQACKIPYVDPATANPPVAAALAKMPMRRHIFLLLSHSPGLFTPIMGVYSAFFSKETRTLPLLDWQLIVLRVSARLKCQYEWDVNAPVASVHGMQPAKLNAVKACCHIDPKNTDDEIFSKREKLILRVVDEQLETYSNENATMESVLDVLNPAELVETIMVIGFYALIARLIRAVGIDPDGEIPGLEDMIKAGVT